jgi:hypothetical protein
MSPTEEYQHGRLDRALTAWGAQLAAGRAWTEVEAEIISCCEGRVDRLTSLLIQAETVRSGVDGARHSPSATRRARRAVPNARRHHESTPDRAVVNAGRLGQQS